MKQFKCIQCGECCRTMGICVTYSDIKKWQEKNRWDILRQVGFTRKAPQGEGFYFGQTIKTTDGCPFLKDNLCSIHGIKPVCCRDAPDSLTEFLCCPVWNKSYINRKRLKKIANRQQKDFKAAVVNYNEIMGILNVAYYGN